MIYHSNWNKFIDINYDELKILTKYITKLHGDYLDDTFHDILIYLHDVKALQTYDPERLDFNTWISYRIKFAFTNLLGGRYKHIDKEVLIDHEEQTGDSDKSLDSDSLLIKNIKKGLSDKQRRIINLLTEGYTCADIARKLNITRQAVHSMVKTINANSGHIKK